MKKHLEIDYTFRATSYWSTGKSDLPRESPSLVQVLNSLLR
jgi:hypothetical protein